MPKYTTDIIAGYTLYFTSKCVIEAMHVHASDKELSEHGSVKLWVYEDGESKVANRGDATAVELKKIQDYIKINHREMYKRWKKYSDNGYYKNK